MFDVGFSEIIFFGIIAIVVLGPEKFPEAIRYFTKLKRKFDVLKDDIQHSLKYELELNELKSELSAEIKNLKQLEKRLDHYLKHIDADQIDQHTYFPVDNFKTPVPFNTKFILEHLMNWSCFKTNVLL